MKYILALVVALLCISATQIQSQTENSQPSFSGGVIVILDGFTVITLEEHQCKTGLSDKHQVLIMDNYGYPLLLKQFKGNILELESRKLGLKTKQLSFVLSSGSCSTSRGIVR